MNKNTKQLSVPAHTQRTLESGRVCTGCGGKLEGIKTVDNSGSPTVWAGCNKCSIFNGGVDREIYIVARRLVMEDHERPYSSMSESDYKTVEEKEYYFSCQIQGMSRLVSRICYLLKEEQQEKSEEERATSEVNLSSLEKRKDQT